MTTLRLTVLLVLGIAGTSSASAADPTTTQQIAALAAQVTALQAEVQALKSMLARDANGNVVQNAPVSKAEQIGLDSTIAVGRSVARQVGASSAETVGGDFRLQVAGLQNVAIQGARSTSLGSSDRLQVGGDALYQFGRGLKVAAGSDLGVTARTIQLNATETLILKTGAASISLRKDGLVVISGAIVDIKASGDVTIKGSKINTN